MGCYYTLCHNTYDYSLLFYKVYKKRENACSWNSGWKRSKRWKPILHNPKSWNSTKQLFVINKNFWAKEIHQGAHTLSRRQGARPPRARPPISWDPWWASDIHLLLYEGFFPGKNRGQAYGTKLCRHEAEPWRNQSRAPAELFCRGHFPPGGGNHHQRHHQRSSHREGNLHQHLQQYHLLSNPSSYLVFNLCTGTSDWYMWVTSSVDYIL